jgi:hypothetical protein
MGRRARLPVAGFVLPTVTMVLLVVILLTVAITLRSFDRGNMARNVRVNQQVLAAATPALDRAKAKIEYMLREDPQRPTSTPSDAELYRIMSSYPANPNAANPDFYTFGGEERLRLRFPVINPGGGLVNADNPQGPLVNAQGQENEAINTAWRYPVDTNNDGIFDTFTLYGIFFRNPPIATVADPIAAVGDFRRARSPLDARTPPMSSGQSANQACLQGTDTVGSLVGESGWYRLDGRLQKSFFVYTVNVPITQADIAANGLDNRFQAFAGTSSISALEYQQDQSRIPLSNNAVVYEDDLDISPGPPLNLNGRIFTNSNLLVSGLNADRSIRLFQVSSKSSCFYDRENSRIVVGGNVVNGSADPNANPPRLVEVHLFKSTGDAEPDANPPAIAPANQSVGGNSSFDVLYNSDAYSRRLDALVASQILAPATSDPVSVQRATSPPLSQQRRDALQSYFKERLRKVPFAEAPFGSNAGVDPDVPIVAPPNTYVEGSGDTLRPREDWSLPTGPGSATVGTANGPTGLTLALDRPPATNPATIPPAGSEQELGDRLEIGNNLPAQRWDGTRFLGSSAEQAVDSGTQWTTGGGQRTRTPQVTKLGEVGATDRGNGLGEAPTAGNPFRDGFWEKAAAQIPISPLEGTGGLRVITSAGVYDRTNSFLPPPRWIDATTGNWVTGPANTGLGFPIANTYDDPATLATREQYRVVWPDSMPMSPLGPGSQVYNNTAIVGNWIDFSATDPAETSTTLLDGIVEASARKYAKGDLRMRASAVYHYADNGFDATALASAPAGTQPNQTPFACVSSYYDPSTASTARNITTGGLPDVSGQGEFAPDVARRDATLGAREAFIGSNNGVTYNRPTRPRPNGPSALDPDTGLLGGGDAVLDAQANLVFPDGRFANGPLRTALQLPETKRTLAQQAAIDSTNCAIQILNGTIVPNSGLIPDGAIQEVAFVNGREVKAIERDNPQTRVNEAFTLSRPLSDPELSTDYNQPVEEREPLEIRATQLDINALRGTSIAGTEWLLPNSGIIYAGRDDALPDRSDRSINPTTGLIDQSRSQIISPSDFRLDPTRKPNGIVLINGQRLFRGGATPGPVTSVTDIVREKGLTLVSNLPVYIQGTFNPHGRIPPGAANFEEVEEFTQRVTVPDWEDFYQERTQLDRNFACRQGDPRLPNCGGDFWRPATVLADAVTLLSRDYRFGFRNEGDFDLRNNAGATAVLLRRQQGFFNNNFVTNGLSSGAFSDNGNLVGTVNASGTVLQDASYVAQNPRLTSSYFNNFVTPVQRRGPFREYVMEVCTRLPVSECTDADWFVDPLAADPDDRRTATATIASAYQPPDPDLANVSFQAGSTADPPVPQLQRFPRRVAFQRGNPDNASQLLNLADPQPLGISNVAGTIAAGLGRLTAGNNNVLWFAADSDDTATTVGGNNVVYTATNLPYLVNTGATAVGTTDGSRVPLPRLTATALPATTVPQPPTVTDVPGTYDYEGSQPLLVPVPQLMGVTAATQNQPRGATNAATTGWIPRAENTATGTTFNLIIAAGDTPSRALLNNASGDFNGGLQNLPRFLEVWNNGGNLISTNIKGSFIQQNRSAFSTAPYLPILPPLFPANAAERLATLFAISPPATPLAAPTPLPDSEELITYNVAGERLPYFGPPTRNWGFDVGVLSQPPDLFTQKFTTPSTRTQPAEYFREVARSDRWVETLMCGVLDNGGAVATSSRPAGCP